MFEERSSKIILAVFLGLGVLSFTVSRAGTGVEKLKDPKLAKTITKECPDYYQNKNGDCLKKTFRSYYFLHRTRSSGSHGSGK